MGSRLASPAFADVSAAGVEMPRCIAGAKARVAEEGELWLYPKSVAEGAARVRNVQDGTAGVSYNTDGPTRSVLSVGGVEMILPLVFAPQSFHTKDSSTSSTWRKVCSRLQFWHQRHSGILAFWHSGILRLCGPSGVVYLNFLLVGIFPSSAGSVSPPPSKSHRDAEAHVDLGLTSTGMTRHLSYPISTGLGLISCLCLAASQHVRTGQDSTKGHDDM